MNLEKLAKSLSTTLFIIAFVLWTTGGYFMMKWKFNDSEQYLKYGIIAFVFTFIIGVAGVVVLKVVPKLNKIQSNPQNNPTYNQFKKLLGQNPNAPSLLNSQEITFLILGGIFFQVIAIIFVAIYYSKRDKRKMQEAIKWVAIGFGISFILSFLWPLAFGLIGFIMNA